MSKEVSVSFHSMTPARHPTDRKAITKLEITELTPQARAIDSTIARFPPESSQLVKDQIGVHLLTGGDEYTYPWPMIADCRNVPRRDEAPVVKAAGPGVRKRAAAESVDQ